jgi:hypothetical protein
MFCDTAQTLGHATDPVNSAASQVIGLMSPRLQRSAATAVIGGWRWGGGGIG